MTSARARKLNYLILATFVVTLLLGYAWRQRKQLSNITEQWEWLASQPGGASVALRKLVQEARRTGSLRDRTRRAQERSYKVMVALAGDRPGFEEAARSLFAGDLAAVASRTERWPRDIREHVLQLADPEFDPTTRTPT